MTDVMQVKQAGVEDATPQSTGKRHRSRSSVILLAIAMTLVTALAAIWIIPMLFALTTSFKSPTEIAFSGFSLLPANWVAENYLALFDGVSTYPVMRWFGNSLVMSTGHAVLMVVVVSIAGYGYTRMRFPGRDVLFFVPFSWLSRCSRAW